MNISDVTVRKLFTEGILRAVVSVTLENVFVVHDVKVLSVGERILMVMPNRKNGDGTFRDVAHPIDPAFRREMETAVLAAYEKAKETVVEGSPTV